MKIFSRIVILLGIIYGNYFLLSSLPIKAIEWNSFLPPSLTQSDNTTLSNGRLQYLFCEIPSEKIPQNYQSSGIIEEYYPLEDHPNTYLLTFQTDHLESVLELTKSYARSGTSIVGDLLFKSFFSELTFYTMVIFPFVMMILLIFIPLKLWFNLLIELGIYLFALSLFLHLGWFEINSASLLSLLFLILFALTLINYLYAEGMDAKRLFFGIQISVSATMLSALFLITSDFGLIHSFGLMLMAGLGVLHLYMNVRIYLLNIFPSHHRYQQKIPLLSTISLSKRTKIFATIAFGISLLLFSKPLSIDLNILNILSNTSTSIQRIHTFEHKHLPTLPFIIQVQTAHHDFSDPKILERFIALQNELEKVIPGTIIASLPKSFDRFQTHARNPKHPDLLAQFLLIESFNNHPFSLCSSDRKRSDIVASIPLSTPTNVTQKMLINIIALSDKYPDFTLSVQGKITDFDYFIDVFVQEFFVGFLVTLLATALFFWFYCNRTITILTIFLSAFFSLGVMASIHLLFGFPITILTLLNVILYAGLITDSLIQLFVCYKREGAACEQSILQPVFISNFAILICLGGMFFAGGMMRAFAFDLAILLLANAVFIIWIVPILHRKYLNATD